MVFPIGRCAEQVLAAIETKKLFNQNIYDFYPDKNKKIGIFKQIMIMISSVYLLLLYILGRSTNKKVDKNTKKWKGPGNWLRFVGIND